MRRLERFHAIELGFGAYHLFLQASGGASASPGRRQALVEIGENIVNMFYADRKPNIAFRNPGRELFFRAELRMRRRRRMNGEAAGIADIGDMVEELQMVDTVLPAAEQYATESRVNQA